MGRGETQMSAATNATRVGGESQRWTLKRGGASQRVARRAALLTSLAAILCLALAAGASAQGARWELISNHGPTNVPLTPAIAQQWTISASGSEGAPNVGRFHLVVEVEGKKPEQQKTKDLPFKATAAEVQSALEAVKSIGAGNVTVTGGPTAGQEGWSYVVTFIGSFEGLNTVESLEAESETTPKELKEVEKAGEEPSELESESNLTRRAARNTVIYQIIPSNLGAVATSGPITVTDKLPPGLVTEETPEAVQGFWSCTPEGEGSKEITCTSDQPVEPDAQAETIFIHAYADPHVIKAGEELENTASISGGGVPLTVKASDSALVSEAPAQFGVHNFKAASYNANGDLDTLAGDHPYAATTSFFFNTVNKYEPSVQEWEVLTPGNLKDADVVLPEGFIGNPEGGRPRCTQEDFTLGARGEPGESTHLGCPPETQVGAVDLYVNEFKRSPNIVPVYNLIPPAGIPAEFGFVFENTPVRLDAHVRRINGKYRVTVLSPDINEAFNISGISLTLWGNPADPSHNPERNKENHDEHGAEDHETPQRPFLTNPADCLTQAQEQPVTTLDYDQWELPGANDSEQEPLIGENEPLWHEANSQHLPPVTGCNELKFEPQATFVPRTPAEGAGNTSEAAAPSGYKFGLEIPQSEQVTTRGTPQLKDTTVTLPAGVSLSPSAANGLQACTEPQINFESTGAGSCPPASQVGEVKIKSALLEEQLTGRVFIGKPECSPCHEQQDEEGKIFRLYIEAEAPHAGVRVKLPGSAVTGTPATEAAGGLKVGQVRTTFDDNPQLPFTTLNLTLKGGPGATLANPPLCGTAFETESVLTPWSVGGALENGTQILGDSAWTSKSSFGISWDGEGAGCPASLPFAPSFSAGSESSAAGAYSPLVTVFKRGDDREQDFSGITVNTPPGLLGKIAGVSKCEAAPEALEKEEAVCPANSRIATATTAAGSGSTPFVVSGPVYLTGASRSPKTGAEGPFGLDIVVPGGRRTIRSRDGRGACRDRHQQEHVGPDDHQRPVAAEHRRGPVPRERGPGQGRPARIHVQPHQLRSGYRATKSRRR